MNVAERKTLLELLAEMPDYRKGNAIKHNLSDILAIGILAIMCDADTFTGMQLFGETHKEALSKILELPHGIPSHDVFGDVFSRVDPKSVGRCFELWSEDMKARLTGLGCWMSCSLQLRWSCGTKRRSIWMRGACTASRSRRTMVVSRSGNAGYFQTFRMRRPAVGGPVFTERL